MPRDLEGKRKDAAERTAKRNALTPQQQLKRLKDRPGLALKETARLQALVAVEKKNRKLLAGG